MKGNGICSVMSFVANRNFGKFDLIDNLQRH